MRQFVVNTLMILMLVIGFTKSHGQSRDMYYKDTLVHDYNDDGYVDSLIEEYSYYSGKSIWFINGIDQKKSVVDATSTFGEFLVFVKIPAELQKPKQLLDSIEKHLFYSKQREKPGHALSWVIKTRNSNSKPDSNSIFYKYHENVFEWNAKPFQKPEHYHIWVGLDSLIHDTLQFDPNEKHGEGWLVYRGGVHQKYWWKKDSIMFKPVFKNKNYTIYKTAHGLIVEKGELYSWMFHTSNYYSGTPWKLRWHSIDSVVVVDDLVFIKQNIRVANTNNLMVFDLRTGELAWVKLKKLPGAKDYYETCFDIKLHASKLYFSMAECKNFGYEGTLHQIGLSPKYFRNLMEEQRKQKK